MAPAVQMTGAINALALKRSEVTEALNALKAL
jgi:hypothetical protein